MSNKQTAILFSKILTKKLEETDRILPTSIGVRRVRPSNKAVVNELRRQTRAKKKRKKKQSNNEDKNEVDVDSIENDGCVNNDLEYDVEEERFEARDASSKRKCDDNDDVTIQTYNKTEERPIMLSSGENDNEHENKEGDKYGEMQKRQYHRLIVDPKIIEQEIAELNGVDRSAYSNLPAVLSPPMTYQAQIHGYISSGPRIVPNEDQIQKCETLLTENSKKYSVTGAEVNDDLARRWAKVIHESIEIEEVNRNKEKLRPLAYQIIPEPWTRSRPTLIGATLSVKSEQAEVVTSASPLNSTEISRCILSQNIRTNKSDQSSWYNKSHKIIYDCLYNQFSNLHISCGAKFGCDYLLYDTCRSARHAFAGLRVCVTHQPINDLRRDVIFPIPTPYDLSGFVRVLNTAGKLALLAMVAQSDQVDNVGRKKIHVLFVDLALEKVVTAHAHVRKRIEKNR